MKRIIFVFYFLLISMFAISFYSAEEMLSGKDIFYKVKGPNGSCNTCHVNGGSAGRWNSEWQEISDDGDKKIPGIKGWAKNKSPEQIEKIINQMKTKYKVPVKDSQIKPLTEYLQTL